MAKAYKLAIKSRKKIAKFYLVTFSMVNTIQNKIIYNISD